MLRRDGVETLHPIQPLEDLYGRLYECVPCDKRYYTVEKLLFGTAEEARWLRHGS